LGSNTLKNKKFIQIRQNAAYCWGGKAALKKCRFAGEHGMALNKTCAV
jgi:hypothetical protein